MGQFGQGGGSRCCSTIEERTGEESISLAQSKRARFDAHRPQCKHTIILVWALGEHKRPPGCPLSSVRVRRAKEINQPVRPSSLFGPEHFRDKSI